MLENKIICGAMPEATKDFPDGYFNCCISSPPYWALRDYGTATWEGGKPDCDHIADKTKTKKFGNPEFNINRPSREKTKTAGYYKSVCPKCGAKRIDKQLGLEPTFEEYIDKLCTIYDEVKRVLRDDGTCFVNLGDTYSGSGGDHKEHHNWGGGGIQANTRHGCQAKNPESIPAKSLCLIPQRFAIEMINRGWILRNVIVWHKPNPMPSSAKDRFTVDFEYVYFFVKSKKYWFEPQYEPHKEPERSTGKIESMGTGNAMKAGQNQGFGLTGEKPRQYNPLGRNKRTVWTIPTQSFPGAHFATFAEKLVEPMIKVGCPEFVCTKCGKARKKIYDREVVHNRPNTRPDANVRPDNYERIPSDWKPKEIKCLGYTDCGCNADWRPGIILDCFCRKLHNWQGSGQAA